MDGVRGLRVQRHQRVPALMVRRQPAQPQTIVDRDMLQDSRIKLTAYTYVHVSVRQNWRVPTLMVRRQPAQHRHTTCGQLFTCTE